jgi:hypothetical protein
MAYWLMRKPTVAIVKPDSPIAKKMGLIEEVIGVPAPTR